MSEFMHEPSAGVDPEDGPAIKCADGVWRRPQRPLAAGDHRLFIMRTNDGDRPMTEAEVAAFKLGGEAALSRGVVDSDPFEIPGFCEGCQAERPNVHDWGGPWLCDTCDKAERETQQREGIWGSEDDLAAGGWRPGLVHRIKPLWLRRAAFIVTAPVVLLVVAVLTVAGTLVTALALAACAVAGACEAVAYCWRKAAVAKAYVSLGRAIVSGSINAWRR